MAAKEISRNYDHATGSVAVTVEDDFGVQSVHTVYLEGHACPMCGHEQVNGNAGDVDLEAEIRAICSERDQRVDRLIPKYEKAGADMTHVKAKRAK